MKINACGKAFVSVRSNLFSLLLSSVMIGSTATTLYGQGIDAIKTTSITTVPLSPTSNNTVTIILLGIAFLAFTIGALALLFDNNKKHEKRYPHIKKQG